MNAGQGTLGTGFDGEVDEAIERPRTPRRRSDASAEIASHALLRLVGDHPGHMGRLRAARVVGGFAVAWRDAEEAADLQRYQVDLDWSFDDFRRLVDALVAGRLMARTAGPRPVLVLTRAGFRALEALDGVT